MKKLFLYLGFPLRFACFLLALSVSFVLALICYEDGKVLAQFAWNFAVNGASKEGW